MADLLLPEGTKLTDLECVMLNVTPFDVEMDMGEAYREEDLFYGDTEELNYAQGIVADTDAHVTLLWGIHPSNDYEEDVWVALDGWDFPRLLINEVGVFQTPGTDYKVVVAHVVPSQALLAGRERLKTLDYTASVHPYKPHITLAYLKADADHKEWVYRLNSEYAHTFVEPIGLDLGND